MQAAAVEPSDDSMAGTQPFRLVRTRLAVPPLLAVSLQLSFGCKASQQQPVVSDLQDIQVIVHNMQKRQFAKARSAC